MFFRHPFFRHAAYDIEHMMTRNMLRNEMIMRNELLRAMNAFEALEQEAFYQGNHRHHRDHHNHHHRHQKQIRAEEKEAQKTAEKVRESEVNNMKAREAEGKKIQESKESRELKQQYNRRGDVFSEWNNSIDNFFRDMSPFGHRYSVFDDFYHPRFDSVGRYAEEMRADMDKHFKNMENPEAKEEYPTLKDPENTSYFMRVETNDNGHVRVKTVKKAPGTAWETKFEEYKREKPAVEKENKQTIETQESKEAPKENLEASQKKEETVKIAEEPQRSASVSA